VRTLTPPTPTTAPFRPGQRVTARYQSTGRRIRQTTTTVREAHQNPRTGTWLLALDAPTDLDPTHLDPNGTTYGVLGHHTHPADPEKD
jgi:hypothetical protein